MKILLAVAVSAGLYALAFPPFGFAALSWIALVPLVLALRSVSACAAIVWSGAWASLAAAAVIPWLVPTLHDHFDRSLAQSLGMYAGVCLVSAAPFSALALGMWAYARERVPRWLGPALFAAAWVAGEYARGQLGLRSPWLKLGDSQDAGSHIAQIADLVGVYGVSGLLAFGNAVLAELASLAFARVRGGRSDPSASSAAAHAAGAFALLLAGALAYGDARLQHSVTPTARPLEIAIVHGDESNALRWRRTTAGRVLRHYGEPTRDLLVAGRSRPDLVIWPENAVQASVGDPAFAPILRSLARQAPLLLGAPRHSGGRVYNSAFLIRSDGDTEHYDKQRLLPFSETRPLGRIAAIPAQGDLDAESYEPGVRPGWFGLGDAQVGILICLEGLYSELARELAAGGATVLVNLSNEGWYRGRGASRQQLAQTTFRAVETRLPLVRATAGGISAVIGPDGRVVEQLSAGERTLLRELPRAWPGPTLYTYWGDTFAHACAAILVLALALGVARDSEPRAVGGHEKVAFAKGRNHD